MNQLQDKFDRIPQKIDRMAIWKGVVRPKRKFPFKFLWGTAILLILALFGLYQETTFSSEADSEFPPAISSDFSEVAPDSSFGPPLVVSAHIPRVKAPIQEEKEGMGSSTSDFSEPESQDSFHTEEKSREEWQSTDQPVLGLPGLSDVDDQFSLLASLNRVRSSWYSLSTPIYQSRLSTIESPIPVVPVPASSETQSLSISVGMGTHRSSFSASNPEGTNLRSELELPRTDFSASLRYEKMLQRNFLFSAAVSYDFYKDRILTSYIRDVEGQQDLIEYELYNHYQIWSGEALFGHRWRKRSYFWDIQAGPGVKLYQASETDYFVAEGQLATEEEIQSIYHRSLDVFGTGQAAAGKDLGRRSFIRAGIRVNAALDLSVPDSPVRHRITSFQPFLEAGIRF